MVCGKSSTKKFAVVWTPKIVIAAFWEFVTGMEMLVLDVSFQPRFSEKPTGSGVPIDGDDWLEDDVGCADALD